MLTFGSENSEINKPSRLAPFVLSIKDDPDNRLSIVIALPKNCPAADEDIADSRLKDILSHSTLVIEDTEQLYEIAFGSYVIYQCRNESYTSYDPTEVMKGKYLVIFERSHFLDYYESVIFDKDTGNEKVCRKHYGVYGENHIIDVISNEPPTIRKINT